jgi:hypothetical protein
MWAIPSYSSLATAVLDYTNTLSLLGSGLFGLVALSGGMLALEAIWHHRSQTGKPAIATAPPLDSYDTAA